MLERNAAHTTTAAQSSPPYAITAAIEAGLEAYHKQPEGLTDLNKAVMDAVEGLWDRGFVLVNARVQLKTQITRIIVWMSAGALVSEVFERQLNGAMVPVILWLIGLLGGFLLAKLLYQRQ